MEEGKRIRTDDKEASRHLQQVLDAEHMIKKEYYDTWEMLRGVYEHGPAVTGDDARSDQALGIVSSTIQGLLPYVFLADPSIYGRPKHQSKEGREGVRAKIAGAALQHQWDEAGDYDEVEDWVIDSFICGSGFARVAYNSTGLMVPYINYDTTTDTDDLVGDDDDEVSDMLADRLSEMGLHDDQKADTAAIQAISPENFIWPWGHTKLRTMPWVAVRHLVHIDDVTNSAEFANAKDIKADRTLSSEGSGQYRPNRGEPDHVEIFEKWYWAWATRKVKVPGGKSKMRKVKELRVMWLCNQGGAKDPSPIILKHTLSHLDMDGYPFEMLRWWRTPQKLVGISLASQLLPFARWLQRITNGAVAGLEAAMALKVLYHEGKLGKNGLQLLNAPRPTAVPVKDKRGVGGAVAPLILPAFPQEFHGLVGLLRGLMAEIGGGDEAMRGGRSSAKSATESAIRATSQKGKTDRMMTIFEKALLGLIKKKWQIMQQYFDADRMVRITGMGDDGDYLSYNRNDIQGEYDIGIHIGSTVPTGPDAERDGFIGFLNSLALAAQAAQAAQVPPQAVAELYQRALDLWDQDSPEIRDSFAGLLQGAASQAGQGPPAQTSPDGEATDPLTGKSLNGGGVPSFGATAQAGAASAAPPVL